MARDEAARVHAGGLAYQRRQAVFRQALRLAPVEIAAIAFPQQAHHIVQRTRARRFLADQQIQAQRHQRALGVIADQRIGRILVLLVIARPRVERAFRDRLLGAAGRARHVRDRLGQQAQVVGLSDRAGAQQQQVVVVGRKALEHPQQARQVGLRKIVGRKGVRLDPLHVPGMEVLVAHQAQKAPVAVALALLAQHRQVLARRHQRRAGAMLQPAVTVARHHRHEDVAVGTVQERRALRARFEERDLCLADLLHVVGDARQIQIRRDAGEHQFVLGPMGDETRHLRRAHLDGMVDQRVVVRRQVQAEAVAAGRAFVAVGFRKAGVDLPALDAARRRQVHQAGQVVLAMHAQENAGAIEEAVSFVQMRAAHRQVPGIDHVLHPQRTVTGRGLPGVVVDFVDIHPPRAGMRGHRFDLARKIADQIAARNPGRQGQALAFGGRRVDR
ncbi:hypothetical protein D3C85_920950 [compost metagenome]